MRPFFRPKHILPTTHLPFRSLATFQPTTPTTAQSITPTTPQPPKLIITPGSPYHNSLPSFLAYASRVNLSPTKTVYVGTHYEYVTALSLLRLGFSLLRTGRKSDAGIDLIGHWLLPPLRSPIPVIVQCKARNITLSPKHVRELEGALQGVPPEWRGKDVLGLLVTTRGATRGVLEALGRNRKAMGFVKVSREGTVEQFVWNKAAGERGLEGVGVTVRHTPRVLLGEGTELEDKEMEQGGEWEIQASANAIPPKRRKPSISGTRKDIILTWLGHPIFPSRQNLDDETRKLINVIAQDVEDVRTKPKAKPKAKPKPSAIYSKTRKNTPTIKPKISKNLTTLSPSTTTISKRRGRPPGSKNKPTVFLEPAVLRKRGRPPGSKNKDKKSSASSEI